MCQYKAFFNRDQDHGGWDVWLAELNAGKDRGEVLDGFIYAQEFFALCDQYGIVPYEVCRPLNIYFGFVASQFLSASYDFLFVCSNQL
jgi:hypothetical protein